MWVILNFYVTYTIKFLLILGFYNTQDYTGFDSQTVFED